MKLLIVDDSAMIRRAINTAYKGSVFTDIQTASDGLLALTVFKEQNPDVVTLDITMPHMDGLAAMSQMLEMKPGTTILVISALADHHTAIEALTRGAHQFICKPFTAEELKEALDNLLNQKPKRGRKKRGRRNEQSTRDQELQQTVAQIVKPPEDSAAPVSKEPGETPSEADYPSGYVEPPAVTETAAVKRQASFQDVYNNMSKDKQND